MNQPPVLASGRVPATFVRNQPLTSCSREVGWELLGTSPVHMVHIHDGAALYPLTPLPWMVTLGADGEEWVIRPAVKKFGQGRVFVTHQHLTAILEEIGTTTGLSIVEPEHPVEISIGEPSMARKTADSGGDFTPADLPDHEFFPVTLVEVEKIESTRFKKNKKPDAPKEWRVMTKWETEDDTDTWIWVYTSNSIGESKGTVSTLRQIINAIHSRKASESLAWFDIDTMEYALTGDVTSDPTGTLAPGLRLQVSGVNEIQDDKSSKFKVHFYKPVGAVPTAAAATPPAASASASPAPTSPTVGTAPAPAPAPATQPAPEPTAAPAPQPVAAGATADPLDF